MARRKYQSRWREQTTFSKFLAIILFILLPLFFFWFGMQLQKTIDEVKYQGVLNEIPQDVLQMPTPGAPLF